MNEFEDFMLSVLRRTAVVGTTIDFLEKEHEKYAVNVINTEIEKHYFGDINYFY